MNLNWDKPEGKAWEAYSKVVRWTHEAGRNTAPTVFMWLQWCLLLAILRYAQIRTGLWPLLAIQILLAFFMWGYFMSLFSDGEPNWLPRERFVSWVTLLEALGSLLATAGLVVASFWFASIFRQHPL